MMENENTMPEVTSEEPTQTSADFDAGWNDGIQTDGSEQEAPAAQTSTEDEMPPAKQPPNGNAPAAVPAETDAQKQDKKADSQSDPQKEDTPAAEQPPAPKIHVKYMDREKDLSMEEAQEFAQKGMNYDRIYSKYEESKPVVELMKSLADRAGMEVPEFVTYIRRQAKQQEGLSESEAKNAIVLEDREAEVSRRETEQAEKEKHDDAANEEDAKRQEDFQKFVKKYPDVKSDTIPQSVWTAVAKGASVVEAYQDYLIANSQADIAAAKQNSQNAAASSGSMQSAGEEKKVHDPMDDGWNDD